MKSNGSMYINTVSNPADEASRGLSKDALVNNQRWISVLPEFLRKEPIKASCQPADCNTILDSDLELKKSATLFSSDSQHRCAIQKLIHHYSSRQKL